MSKIVHEADVLCLHTVMLYRARCLTCKWAARYLRIDPEVAHRDLDKHLKNPCPGDDSCRVPEHWSDPTHSGPHRGHESSTERQSNGTT